MRFTSEEVRPLNKPGHVLNAHGCVLRAPADWALLPPGDPALSRRIKQDGPSWTVVELKGRKRFSRGIWAPRARLEALEAELAAERADPAYQRKLDAGRRQRAAKQEVYAGDFREAVLDYLAFHHHHGELAGALATLIADHAVPVGSGTVARTERIPIAERAEAATIAWMRHQTTAYDAMEIPRHKGARREVRRLLARRSKQLLDRYRAAPFANGSDCPLQAAVRRLAGLRTGLRAPGSGGQAPG